MSTPEQSALQYSTLAWQPQDAPAGGIGIPTSDMPSPQERRDERRSVSPARGRRDDGETNPGNNLHVSGLSRTVETRELEAEFAKVGRVQKANVMYDPHTRESRGFAFVTMETPEEADAAIAALNGTEMWGRVITITRARRGRARTPTPGQYYGPPKRSDRGPPRSRYPDRPYESRGYGGDRYSRDYPPPPRRYDDRDRDRYDRRDRYDDRDRRDYRDRPSREDYRPRYDDRRY
ncbi:RNA-binding domain-containing protein [Cylindrobasidium torrendii FP15055 ss-10]|uniref:RNA-binding domain-containing protein n=1 Tax=Cylindrobasidium torrendii FP15055 ss-10 TaxID=1314674 RepID=A0A0D7AVZ9_9AGAR|nr:RNA-binding domain-containing protein [Cylindrobasidium torrendii FP15055 ss-10]